VKIVERLTKSESKTKKRKKNHEASYIVVEVGDTSTFVTHDVTKVEVRWAETHLKLKSHAPKERGRLTSRTFAGLSDAQGQGGPCLALAMVLFFFHYLFWYFQFCICFAYFFWRFSLFLCSNVRFQNFVQISSIVDFFLYNYFFQLSFFDFLFKILFTMYNI
jgi:hypothetical protein